MSKHYLVLFYCGRCKRRLKHKHVLHGDGLCPYCGHDEAMKNVVLREYHGIRGLWKKVVDFVSYGS